MQRELCLILDTKGIHRLVLESKESYELDEYTSKKFENSSDVRKKYQKEIEEFLEQYKELLKKSNNPSYTGRIGIVIPEKVGGEINDYQKQVLYKKHIVVFNSLIKNKIIMRIFAEYQLQKTSDKRLVSEFFCDKIKSNWNQRNAVKKFIDEWIKKEKQKKTSYYKIIRDVLSVYEQEKIRLTNMLSIDELYLKYKQEKEENAKKRVSKRKNPKLQKNKEHTIVEGSVVIEETEKYYNVNGQKYTLDELHLVDLEEINIDESDYIPDGVKKI